MALRVRKFVIEEWLAVSSKLISHALYYKIPYLRDQHFFKIMVPSGFRRFGHLTFINQFSTASDRNGAKIVFL